MPTHLEKVPVGFALSLLVGGIIFSQVLSAFIFAGVMGIAFLNPWHSQFQRMGRPQGDASNPSLMTCILGYALSYGGFTTVAACLVALTSGEYMALWYAPIGVLVGPAYALAWWAYEKFKIFDATGAYKKFWHTNDLTQNGVTTAQWFIDGPTSVGEFGMGALLIGGLPLVYALAQL